MGIPQNPRLKNVEAYKISNRYWKVFLEGMKRENLG